MSNDNKDTFKESEEPTGVARSIGGTIESDDLQLEKQFGIKNEFLREFGNLSTFSFAFSIMGMVASIATTFDTPLLYAGGPASAVWCWFIGSIMNLSLAASIAEIISAYPTCGGLYSASAWLVPRKYRAVTGWLVGWLNLLGQVAGVASTEWGLAQMIWSAVLAAKDGNFYVSPGMQYGLFAGLLVMHGILNSLPTKDLARLTGGFVFINIGMTFIIIICLLALTPRSEMHTAKYVFTEIYNPTGYENSGLAFLFGLLSVQWTMTDYDAVAHISGEVRRAAIAAPVALFTAVIGTGMIGWVLNIVLVLCSPPIDQLPGASGRAFIEIMRVRIGLTGTLVLWPFVCLVACFTVQTALQANSRTLWAFSHDHALPDWGLFGRMNKTTKTPLWAVWGVVVLSLLLGLLGFASPIAVQAIFSMCAVALDLSYIIPVITRRIWGNHPEVNFVPGPFYMGEKIGLIVNCIMVLWTLFEVIILCFPTFQPMDKNTFNYSWVITIGVLILSFVWYSAEAKKRYTGPREAPIDVTTGEKPSSILPSNSSNEAPPHYADSRAAKAEEILQ